MATSRRDFQAAVDRSDWMPNRGFLVGFPFLPGQTSNATTGVPTDGVAGFATGALFYNVKATTTAPRVYVNTGSNTSATWTPLALGGATSLRVTGGAAALDGSNPTPVVTGLTTILAFSVNLAVSAIGGSGLSTSVLTGVISSGTLNVYGWKPTGAGDTTLIATDGTDSFSWLAVGV